MSLKHFVFPPYVFLHAAVAFGAWRSTRTAVSNGNILHAAIVRVLLRSNRQLGTRIIWGAILRADLIAASRAFRKWSRITATASLITARRHSQEVCDSSWHITRDSNVVW